jgi:dynein heavy chain, axonemal
MDTIATNLANSILSEVPELFNVKEAEKNYPVSYEQSMNTVLTQELSRFNNLIRTIKSSLKDMKRAILGEILMSEDMEAAMISMTDGQIPGMWLKNSFPSLKPLGSYIKDLKDRLEFFDIWVREGVPDVFWINKFYFTHGFLTGAMQNYARKYSIAIDTLEFDFNVIHDVPEDGKGISAPEDGIHVLGMYIEGCKWDSDARVLGESDPKILYTVCPMIWFRPSLSSDISNAGCYACPLFKTGDRRGVLMTTGHSTNYVCDVKLPSSDLPSHWIKRGVAMLCALSQ